MAVVDIFITDKKYNVIYADPPWAYTAEGPAVIPVPLGEFPLLLGLLSMLQSAQGVPLKLTAILRQWVVLKFLVDMVPVAVQLPESRGVQEAQVVVAALTAIPTMALAEVMAQTENMVSPQLHREEPDRVFLPENLEKVQVSCTQVAVVEGVICQHKALLSRWVARVAAGVEGSVQPLQ